MTPERSAEMWLGAAGGASGSQTWSGTRPALVPNPTTARAGGRIPFDRYIGMHGIGVIDDDAITVRDGTGWHIVAVDTRAECRGGLQEPITGHTRTGAADRHRVKN